MQKLGKGNTRVSRPSQEAPGRQQVKYDIPDPCCDIGAELAGARGRREKPEDLVAASCECRRIGTVYGL